MQHGVRTSRSLPNTLLLLVLSSAVLAVLVWQALTAQGNPDPTAANLSPLAAITDTGILVFREGLEAILVLSALTASMVRSGQSYWKPVGAGAGLAGLASLITWFVVVAVMGQINAPALQVQAATGLLAIVVLLIIMNWFFHKVYWTGWIGLHNRKKRELTEVSVLSPTTVYRGLALLGFTAVYREGFEIVLFLQSLRLRMGSGVVLEGVLIGLALTAMAAVITFLSHHKLPYKKMLILTGVMLGGVLLVMVGESVQECQQAGWLATTPLPLGLPAWLGTWFAVFPNLQGLLAQALAGALVIGSYFAAGRLQRSRRPAQAR
ncbi:MAG: FTR1 family protein [Thermaceae bacterium]|nr:FTR1 family protein [Thermaceae bacterium]